MTTTTILILALLYMYISGIVAIHIFAKIERDDQFWVTFWPIILVVWLGIKLCQFFKL